MSEYDDLSDVSAGDLDFHDPGEDEQQEAEPQGELEAEGEQEDDDLVGQESEEQEPQAFDGDDGIQVPLEDGSTRTLGELKADASEFQRMNEELRSETEALGQTRQSLSQYVQAVPQAIQLVEQNLANLLGPPPEQNLKQSNPQEYAFQMMQRQEAAKEFLALLGPLYQATNAQAQIAEQDLAQIKQTEVQKLVRAMPQLKSERAMSEHTASTLAFAKEVGFTEADYNSTADHRLHVMMHYGAIGFKTVQNQKNAKRRIAGKPLGKAQAASKAPPNKSAMRNLSKTGSFEDAMQIDFD